MASVCRPGQQPKAVKNLGWLLKHKHEVKRASVNKLWQDRPGRCFLEVWLEDGTKFTSSFFKSQKVCASFVGKLLRHSTNRVTWFGEDCLTVGWRRGNRWRGAVCTSKGLVTE